MKELIALSGIASYVATTFSLCVFLYGLFSLITGKFALTKKNLIKGSPARIAGVILIVQFLIALVTVLVIGDELAQVNNPGLEDFCRVILFLFFAIVGLHIAIIMSNQ